MRVRLIIGSKRKCLFLLSLYLSLSGIFLLLFKRYKLERSYSGISFSNKYEYFGSLLRENNIDGQHWFDLNSALMKDNRTIDTPNSCLSQHLHQVDGKMMDLLSNKGMLHYFKFGNNYAISVPKWQTKVDNYNNNKDKRHTFYIASVIRVRLYPADKAKWTIRELKQWLHYQFWAGSEHVYICMHYLDDEERFDKYLTKYINHGLVTVYRWTNITAIPGSKTYEQDNADNQISCYNHVLKHHGDKAVWHYNFDLDENPYVPSDHCEGFLTRFLEKVDKRTSELRLSNYVMEGQGDRSRDIFYDRINRITRRPPNGNVKPIYRLALTKSAGMHGCKTTGKLVYPVHTDIKLLHYWGARKQNWKNDTNEMFGRTSEFNDVRNSIAINIRHSLVAFGDYDAFSTKTGP